MCPSPPKEQSATTRKARVAWVVHSSVCAAHRVPRSIAGFGLPSAAQIFTVGLGLGIPERDALDRASSVLARPGLDIFGGVLGCNRSERGLDRIQWVNPSAFVHGTAEGTLFGRESYLGIEGQSESLFKSADAFMVCTKGRPIQRCVAVDPGLGFAPFADSFDCRRRECSSDVGDMAAVSVDNKCRTELVFVWMGSSDIGDRFPSDLLMPMVYHRKVSKAPPYADSCRMVLPMAFVSHLSRCWTD